MADEPTTPISIGRIGFLAGVAACTATVTYDVAQILQVIGVLHFPRDEILIFGASLCIVIPFVLEVLALHHSTPSDERFWSHAALLSATIYAVFGTANYVVQLTTVIPAKLRGASEGIRILEQTPHSLFWDFDAIAYIAMGLTTLTVIPTLRGAGLEWWVRMSCIANVIATGLAGIVYFYPMYSYKLLLLGFPWGITAPLFMLLLGVALRLRRTEPGDGRSASTG